jgi:hypothetical protein
VLLKPTTTQRTSPTVTRLQETDLPAAVAAAPLVKKFVPAGERSEEL